MTSECSCPDPQGVRDADGTWYIRTYCPESRKKEWMKEGAHYHGDKYILSIYVTGGRQDCKYTKDDEDKILKSWREWAKKGETNV
jgi:hypothetical protein